MAVKYLVHEIFQAARQGCLAGLHAHIPALALGGSIRDGPGVPSKRISHARLHPSQVTAASMSRCGQFMNAKCGISKRGSQIAEPSLVSTSICPSMFRCQGGLAHLFSFESSGIHETCHAEISRTPLRSARERTECLRK
jgi:hypothetical protein